MTLRPIATRWFELVTVHKELARTVECLARTGAVHLEAQSGRSDGLVFPDIDDQLKAYHEFARRYRSYWPLPASTGRRPTERLSDTLGAARQRLALWAEQADPIIASVEELSLIACELDQLDDALAHVTGAFPDLARLAAAGPRLHARLIRLPKGTELRELPAPVLSKTWEGSSGDFVLAVGRAVDIDEIESQLAGLKGRILALPQWLPSSLDAARHETSVRRRRAGEALQQQESRLAALSKQFQLATALGDIVLVEWLSHHAKELRGSRRLAWVTGWTNDSEGTRLRRALDGEGIRYVIRLTEAPAGTNAPMVLSNPGWVRGFEVFARLLGTPARDESDPSLILAVIVPLIFGFMFGDVGQGLIVLLAGVVLGPRNPLLKVLVPGGLMAMAFGLLFGSVFSREDVIPALWLRPMEHPVTVLLAALGGGVAVLLIGLLLDGIQAHWRGEAQRWWGCRVGLPIAYVGLLYAPFDLSALLVAGLGAAWYMLGAVALAKGRRFTSIGPAAAEFFEESLRLLVNTVSFARVGAFALAHAGLSFAVVEVAAAAGPVGYWIVLALGNVLIIALDGLVVSIQAARLMLFEFFIHFLTARGREFMPLPPPDFAARGTQRQSLGSMS